MDIRNKKICNNCVMDTSSPDIKFNKNGICNYCITYKNKIGNSLNNNNKETQLEKIISKIRNFRIKKNLKYDCLIGISGGLDSSYLVYYLVEKLGIKPLLFHVDAGWNSSISSNNIQKLVDKLDLDLITEVINWNEMRDLHLSYFKSGVPSLDTIQDHAFFGAMYKYVEKNNFKFILTGANLATEFIRAPLDWAYHASDTKFFIGSINFFFSSKLIALSNEPTPGKIIFLIFSLISSGLLIILVKLSVSSKIFFIAKMLPKP